MTIPTTDICTALTELLNSMDYDRLFILTDVHTHSLCLPLILGVHAIAEATTITIPAGDEHKNLDTLSSVWDALEDGMATRHSILLCLGGGVITDLGGFAAATFKRGIRFIHIPTTLLAMVDAATGGKTGINYGGLKNAIGVFQMPEQVLLYPDFLHTLDKENLRSGLAEMCKHALIDNSSADASSNDSQNGVALMECLADTFLASQPSSSQMLHFIASSVNVKERIVAADPTEKGLRKALNFGHTSGHAIEELMLEKGHPVLHGYAVGWGMMGELYLSQVECGFPVEQLRQAARLLHELFGPCPVTCNDYDKLYEFMLHDKKNKGGYIQFTLLAKPGDIRLDCSPSRRLIFEAIDFVRES